MDRDRHRASTMLAEIRGLAHLFPEDPHGIMRRAVDRERMQELQMQAMPDSADMLVRRSLAKAKESSLRNGIWERGGMS